MENNPDQYEPGIDQNQGVVGTMARNQQQGDAVTEGTQVPDLDPNRATNQAENGAVDPDTDAIGERNYVNDEGVD